MTVFFAVAKLLWKKQAIRIRHSYFYKILKYIIIIWIFRCVAVCFVYGARCFLQQSNSALQNTNKQSIISINSGNNGFC